MPLSSVEHIDSILKHLELVRNNCILLAKRLIVQGHDKFARDLIVRGFRHDLSKFFDDAEWCALHAGKDTPKDKLVLAIEHHRSVNDHHVEFWKSIHEMPELAVAEMCCDIMARCQEFGECFRDWIQKNIIHKHNLQKESNQYKWINKFVETLLENEFVK